MKLINIFVLYIILLLVSITASSVIADNIVSRPAGYLKVYVESNSNYLVCFPFDPLEAYINQIFENQLTGNTNDISADHIFKWDNVKQNYISAIKIDGEMDREVDGKWFTDISAQHLSDLTFAPGEGFFINNRQAKLQEVFLCGEVVLDDSYITKLHPGFNLVGHPYSSSVSFDKSAIADAWKDETNKGQIVSDKIIDVSTNAFEGRVLQMAKAYWYHRMSDQDLSLTESRPYDNPFPQNTDPPQIAAIMVSNKKDAMILTIECTGKPEERLDIYYQDISISSGFNPSNPWKIAAENIDSNGKRQLTWKDDDKKIFETTTNIEGRCYLVARSDIDNNSNHISDAREQFNIINEHKETESILVTTNISAGKAVQAGKVVQAGNINPISINSTSSRNVKPRGSSYWELIYLAGDSFYPIAEDAIRQIEDNRSNISNNIAGLVNKRIELRQSKDYKMTTKILNDSQTELAKALSSIPEIAEVDAKIKEQRHIIMEIQKQNRHDISKLKMEMNEPSNILTSLIKTKEELKLKHKDDFPDTNSRIIQAKKQQTDILDPVKDIDKLKSELHELECQLKWKKRLLKGAKEFPPSWWKERKLDICLNSDHDYEHLSFDQFKNVVLSAYEEVKEHLPGDPPRRLSELIANITNSKSSGPVMKSQLRHVASVFYDSFTEKELSTCRYPWGGIKLGEIDFVPVEIGEMRYLFSFDLQNNASYPVIPPKWWEPGILEARNLTTISLFEAIPAQTWNGGTNNPVIMTTTINPGNFIPGWDRFYLSSDMLNIKGSESTGILVRINGKIYKFNKDNAIDITDAITTNAPLKIDIIQDLPQYTNATNNVQSP